MAHLCANRAASWPNAATCGQDLNGDGREDAAVAKFTGIPIMTASKGNSGASPMPSASTTATTSCSTPSPAWSRSAAVGIRRRTPTGQVSGPSLVTRYRFHTAAGDQLDNDDYGGNIPGFRLVDEVTETGGREEEALKLPGRWRKKSIPWCCIPHPMADSMRASDAAALAATPDAQARLTPDAYVYTPIPQDWIVRRLYRPAEALPYFADQGHADGILEDCRAAPVAPIPQKREGCSPAWGLLSCLETVARFPSPTPATA